MRGTVCIPPSDTGSASMHYAAPSLWHAPPSAATQAANEQALVKHSSGGGGGSHSLIRNQFMLAAENSLETQAESPAARARRNVSSGPACGGSGAGGSGGSAAGGWAGPGWASGVAAPSDLLAPGVRRRQAAPPHQAVRRCQRPQPGLELRAERTGVRPLPPDDCAAPLGPGCARFSWPAGSSGRGHSAPPPRVQLALR